jgi:hypothetical protein
VLKSLALWAAGASFPAALDKPQGGFTQFDSGYLSPYFVTDPVTSGWLKEELLRAWHLDAIRTA